MSCRGIINKAVIIINQLVEIVSTSGSRPRVRDPITVFIHQQSVLADRRKGLNARYVTIDLTDYYLDCQLDREKYLWIPMKHMSAKTLDELHLHKYITNEKSSSGATGQCMVTPLLVGSLRQTSKLSSHPMVTMSIPMYHVSSFPAHDPQCSHSSLMTSVSKYSTRTIYNT